MHTRVRTLVGWVIGLVLTVGIAPARAEGDGFGARALEGVWAMTITLRDCGSGAPLGPPFRSMLTFHAGGTVSETPAGTTFAIGQRANGHGVWRHLGGRTFSTRILAMILFDTSPPPPAPGVLAGWQLIAATFTLADSGRLDLTARTEFFDLNRQVYRAACPTGTAERFR